LVEIIARDIPVSLNIGRDTSLASLLNYMPLLSNVSSIWRKWLKSCMWIEIIKRKSGVSVSELWHCG